MRSQSATLLALTLGAACSGKPVASTVSPVSTPAAPLDAPDLALRGVAFARLADGRLVARGTAAELDYRRAGGRLGALDGNGILVPEPGTGLASFGAIHFTAPRVDGEVAVRRGNASGGVKVDTGRGDRAATEAISYDGATVRSSTRVTARGPGYTVEGNGLIAKADGSAVQLTRGVTGQLQMEARR